MQDNTISSEELACVGIHCTHGMRQKGETAMKVTSTKKDLMLYGAMTILFAVGSILYIDLHGFTMMQCAERCLMQSAKRSFPAR